MNAVGPGPIDTRFLSGMEISEEEQEEFEAGVTNMVPLSRMGTAEEVAAVCCFLLSDEASYVTGSEYMVDGGMTMR